VNENSPQFPVEKPEVEKLIGLLLSGRSQFWKFTKATEMSIDIVTGDDNKHCGDVTSVIYFNEHVYSAGSDGKIKVC